LKFKDAVAVATFVNEGFKCDLISGRDIRDAVSNGMIGVVRRKNGRNVETPEEDCKDLASLLFTANTIDQSNAAVKRLTKPDQRSIIGSILNHKRKADGKAELNGVSFFRDRIEKSLDKDCTISFAYKRELLRLLWLSFEQQLKPTGKCT